MLDEKSESVFRKTQLFANLTEAEVRALFWASRLAGVFAGGFLAMLLVRRSGFASKV